jgi:hypothetical protein
VVGFVLLVLVLLSVNYIVPRTDIPRILKGDNWSRYLTFSEHSGNIEGTLGEHSRDIYIQGTSREHSGNIQGTSREHPGNI